MSLVLERDYPVIVFRTDLPREGAKLFKSSVQCYLEDKSIPTTCDQGVGYIYLSGRMLSYTDFNVIAGTRYFYRLAKLDGTWISSLVTSVAPSVTTLPSSLRVNSACVDSSTTGLYALSVSLGVIPVTCLPQYFLFQVSGQTILVSVSPSRSLSFTSSGPTVSGVLGIRDNLTLYITGIATQPSSISAYRATEYGNTVGLPLVAQIPPIVSAGAGQTCLRLFTS